MDRTIRRINKELELYNYKYKYYKIFDDHITMNIGDLVIYIHRDYPFRYPKVYTTKGYSYIQMLINATELLESKRCLCCVSVLCDYNWCSSFRINDILVEYNLIRNRIKTLKKFRYLDKILWQNNLEDLSIMIKSYI